MAVRRYCFPAADAFGFAVYDITARDGGDPASGAARSTTKRITIAINPVNDDPVAFDRSLSVAEAVEVDAQDGTADVYCSRPIEWQSSRELPTWQRFPRQLDCSVQRDAAGF